MRRADVNHDEERGLQARRQGRDNLFMSLNASPRRLQMATMSRGGPVRFGDFLAHKFPAVDLLLDPWLPRRGIAMIFGRAGVGKTILAQTTAYALATGGAFLGWRAPTPSRVLYVDCEMDPAELGQRFAAIHAANRTIGIASPTENLAIMTHADANGDSASLTSPIQLRTPATVSRGPLGTGMFSSSTTSRPSAAPGSRTTRRAGL